VSRRLDRRKKHRNASTAKALTEDPEDETDLNFSDELIDGSERLFEQRLDLLASHHFIGVQRRAEYVAGRRAVSGDGARLTLETERGQSKQDQEADVRQRVCYELGCRTANRVPDLPHQSINQSVSHSIINQRNS